jgi:lysophospholipase L1-like esterase
VKKNSVFSLLLGAFVLVALELLSRGYWALLRERGLFDRDLLLNAFYPELAPLAEGAPARRDDERFDVLVLDASTLARGWGSFPKRFDAALRARGRPFRVYSLAVAGHTSRDSLLKYRLTGRHRFDLVLVYHGINDLRADDVPPERFRADYSHMDWYREVEPIVTRRALARVFTLPFTARRAWLVFSRQLGLRESIGLERIHVEWAQYGAAHRSVASLRANLAAILAIARERGDPVALASFASYVPPNYSREAFDARALDYAYRGQSVPLEVWGLAENIVRGLAAQNEAIAALAAEHPDVRFVDVAAAIPREGRYFKDVCHLSREGMERLVAAVVKASATPSP